MELKKVKRKRMSIEIINQLIRGIKDGYFKVNEKMPKETILAEKFGVSRPTIREALSALEVSGILLSRSGDGTYLLRNDVEGFLENKTVSLVSSEERPFEIVEARRTVECEISSLSAKKASQKSIKKIELALRNMIEEQKKFGSWSAKSDKNFHLEIAKSVENDILSKVTTNIINLMDQSIWKNLRDKILLDKEKSKKYLNHHKNLFKAIANKNSDEAKKIMNEHFEDLEKDFNEDIE